MKFCLFLIFSLLSGLAMTGQAQVKHTAKKPAQKAAAPSALSTSIKNGKAVYLKYCLTCHQADGGGVQNMNPPLIKTSYVQGNKQKLISIVLHGLSRQEI